METPNFGPTPEGRPVLDIPRILAALGSLRDSTTNPEVRTLTCLMADLCFNVMNLEGEIDERQS
jgi:hypothetical protein